jgi:Tol biopolymer transport system component
MKHGSVRQGTRPRLTAVALALTVVPVAVALSAPPVIAGAATFERASLSSLGGQGDASSRGPAMSADGRYVAFQSDATNLVAGDTNVAGDVFVRDRRAGTTIRVNVSVRGAQADGPTYQSPVMNGDGRYVAFVSLATNLVPGDTNGLEDLFVRDLRAGRTIRANVSGAGEQANAGGDEPSTGSATISADGRYLAFFSTASNLVAGDTNGVGDVFLRDLRAGTTIRVSVSDTEAQAGYGGFNPAISGDGRYVGFVSDTPDLVRRDTNGVGDMFVRDVVTGTTSRINVSSTGGQVHDGESYRTYLALSADGRYVTFTSNATTLVPDDTNQRYDVFLRDRGTGTTSRVSVSSAGDQGDNSADGPTISADGRFIVFHSAASNLVPEPAFGGTALFIRDVRAATTRLITGGGGYPYGPRDIAVSSDGRHVAFTSGLPGLVAGDTNDTPDVFVWHRTR